ncbi:MAG: Tn3 family transposase [Rubrobacter sp.]
MRKRYREGQEDQLSSLGLVLNAVALWNTLYLDRARPLTSKKSGARRSARKIWPGSPRSSTRTSACLAATTSGSTKQSPPAG